MSKEFKFVELETTEGDTVFINPFHVDLIKDYGDSAVFFTHGHPTGLEVPYSAKKLVKQLLKKSQKS